METKSLLYGLIGFFLGGLLVSLAATYLEPNKAADDSMAASMRASTESLKSKTGDDFDKAFISDMVMHHQGAIDMAKLAQKNARHDEVKQLSKNIISTQENEIVQMKQWQSIWGYQVNHGSH